MLSRHEIVLACVGLSLDGSQDLTMAEHLEIEKLASELHRRGGWRAPPCPFHLASLEGVTLYELSPGEDGIYTLDRAYYARRNNAGCTGLMAAHALAGVMALRRSFILNRVAIWALAAELLVPAWASERDLDEHPSAPPWLVGLRTRVGRWDAPSARAS